MHVIYRCLHACEEEDTCMSYEEEDACMSYICHTYIHIYTCIYIYIYIHALLSRD
jgi:hypothetical protein